MNYKTLLLVLTTLTLSACWNGGSSRLYLGDVSIGQQMIDLKTALESGALSQAEYDSTKQTLLSLTTMCSSMQENVDALDDE